MQPSRNKDVRFQLPDRYERYCIAKSDLRGKSEPKVFPIRTVDGETIRKLEYVGQVGNKDWAGDGKQLSRNAREGYRVYSDIGIAPALRSQLGGASKGSQIIQVNHPTHSNDVDGQSDRNFIDLSTLNPKQTEVARAIQSRYAKGYSHHAGEVSGVIHQTAQGGRRQPKVVIPVLTPDRLNKRQNGRRFKTNGEPAFTLNGQDRHGVTDGVKIRRLTPLECERLMSWPDNWTKEPNISDTQRYKMCGNGVVSKVVEAIIERLYEKPLSSAGASMND